MATNPQKALEARAKAEAEEYATYRAKVPIYHEGSIAYRPGHAVPVSNVEFYKYDEQGLVEKITGEAKTQAQQQNPVRVGEAEVVGQ